MTASEVALLQPGLYRIMWKEEEGGGMSLAAVGVTRDGGRWLAPTNWLAPVAFAHRSDWAMIERMVRFHPRGVKHGR